MGYAAVINLMKTDKVTAEHIITRKISIDSEKEGFDLLFMQREMVCKR